ncbi:MAG TPA: histidine kinase [Bacteroidota bacterium]|nr:histidine kinase [Bacteroidota bacterium]
MNIPNHDISNGSLAHGLLHDYLESIINSIATPVLVKDAQHRWVLVNDACCDFLGYSRQMLIGKTDYDRFPKGQADLFWERDEQLLRTMREIVDEETLTDARGVDHTILTKKNVHIDPSGESFIVSVITDITERKKFEDELTESRQQLRNLSAHTDAIVEKERTRIAREVHDELGQSLTALKMDCAWLERRFNDTQVEFKARTRMMSQLIDDTIKTVRRISTELRPEMLDDLGLAATLEWQLTEFQKRTGIEWTATITPKDIDVSTTVSTAAYRVFLETLTNIARHAQATAMNVELTLDERELRLHVEDNGVGITQEQITHPASLGLLGIRERVGFLGGTVKIAGRPAKGTVVEIRIPITIS